MKTFLSVSGFALLTLASSYGATISQTVNQSSGSGPLSTSAIWGTPAAAATAGNDYVTVAGLATAADSGFGSTYTSRIRDNGTTFAGNSLTLVGTTELLMKNSGAATTTGNFILNGGIIAYGNAGSITTILAGNLAVPSTGILGMGSMNTLNIASTLTGSGILSLRASDTTPTIEFSGDLSGFNGTFQIGGGTAGFVNVDFTQAYTLSANITMGTVGISLDVLDLSANLTVNSFQFGTTDLAAGTYTASQLNSLVGNGSQFTGSGTFTTITTAPEPSAVVLLGSIGTLFLLFHRRVIRRSM